MSNLSAYALIHGDPLVAPMRTVVACNDPSAGEQVKAFLNSLGINAAVVPSLSYAASMEARHKALLPEWQVPFVVMTTTWLCCQIYTFIRYNYYGGSSWTNVTMWVSSQ
jgi:hypothetical protein